MTLPAESISKLDALSEEKLKIVIQVIDQLSEDPVSVFRRLRKNGTENPLTEYEVDAFLASVRSERNIIND